MSALALLQARLRPTAERVDRMSLRERALVFAVGVVLVYVAWQSLLMDPLAARTLAASQRLDDVNARLQALDTAAANGDPRLAALTRQAALRERLATLDARLADAASGYVPPERMAELLRDVLAKQHGLRLVSLRNLPVEVIGAAGVGAPAGDAAAAAGATAGAPATGAAAGTPTSAGPFVHPVELVIDGDYASVVAYLHALEELRWRLNWRRIEVSVREYPSNRVRIVLGTLSLSREWLSV